ncbi:Txe/YoeB family addiction module toxin [Weissella minor]|uniref:Txe/YoeB family addiction module toxin n=1 Tax=Weissella minor TaxID=1620 RepID=UPI001BAF78CD|nr:Txe/YoeB family addiction module toxin [Weissella minor]MBS0949526.1 Txe/YoeB family addiction module toxin [Weissella minor]
MIFENKQDVLQLAPTFVLKQHRSVTKKDVPELIKRGLKDEYDEILEILRRKPTAHVRSNEQLKNYKGLKKAHSMRINGKERVVFTIDKVNQIVWIWSAFGHYNDN